MVQHPHPSLTPGHSRHGNHASGVDCGAFLLPNGHEPLGVRLCFVSLMSFELLLLPLLLTAADAAAEKSFEKSFETVTLTPPKTGAVVPCFRCPGGAAAGEAAGGAAVGAAAFGHNWTWFFMRGVRPEGTGGGIEEVGSPRSSLDFSLDSQKGLDLTDSFFPEPVSRTSGSSVFMEELPGGDVGSGLVVTANPLASPPDAFRCTWGGRGRAYGCAGGDGVNRTLELLRLRVTRSDELSLRTTGTSSAAPICILKIFFSPLSYLPLGSIRP